MDLRFWKGNTHVEIPLEVTQIVCLDPAIIRTAGGTVHPTPSDADLIESKVIAVLNRIFLQHRDLVDIFLYGDKLRPEMVAQRLKDLQENREYHATAIQKVIDQQMEPTVAQQMNSGGGGRAVLDPALNLILKVCPP